MEYTVNGLAKLSGVSTRTIRYYDEIGLLKPARVSTNNYRIYGENEVETLQQILFYRELGVSLDEIKMFLSSPEFDKEASLKNHLIALLQKKSQIETLIKNVNKTINAMKGKTVMSDKEKFEGFKQSLIDENEKKYGNEIRKKYGDKTINNSNAKIKGMSEEQWQAAQNLSEEINKTLKTALEQGDPSSEAAQKACDLHRQWICMFWADGAYSKEAHKGLGEMYVADERFRAYYDKIDDGAAVFLRDAINIFCGK